METSKRKGRVSDVIAMEGTSEKRRDGGDGMLRTARSSRGIQKYSMQWSVCASEW